MRHILIKYDGRIVGGFWTRETVEISRDGIVAGEEFLRMVQFCPSTDAHVSYEVRHG